jgi:uncharacterized membrane protein
MKKYFTTGLAILLPMLLTMIIVGFLVNLLTKPFLGTAIAILDHFDLFEDSTSFFENRGMLVFFSKLLILTVLAGFIFLVGLLGKLFLIDYLFRIGNRILHNLPYVNKIYKACQDVVHGLFSPKSTSFSQVVFVPFPNAQALSLGLITRDAITLHASNQDSDVVPVFVPGTPNPSVGFMLMFKKEQLIFVNMKIDEAMKFVVSCGVVMPDFKVSALNNVRNAENV